MNVNQARGAIEAALERARQSLESGRSGTQTAETLYDDSVTASQVLTSEPRRSDDDEALIEALGRLMLRCGYVQLEAQRDDTRKLDAILRSTRMLLGREPYPPALQKSLDDAYQDWHWHGH